MGYESRLFVVRKGATNWAEVIGMIDLCKAYAVSDKMRNYPDTEYYIYSNDGNTKITEDCYGKPLKEIPLDDAINIIKQAWKNDSDYDRYYIALQMLMAFKNSAYNNVVILHYGY